MKKRYIDPSELMELLRKEAKAVVQANGKFQNIDNVPFFIDEIDQYIEQLHGIEVNKNAER